MLTWRLAALALACVVVGGCSEPGAIIQTAPPGEKNPRVVDEKDKSEALGESAAQGARGSTTTQSKPAIASIEPAPATAKGETKTTKSGVKYETIQEGTGPEAKPGQTVKVHYTGTLEDGTKFDSSRDRNGEPFTFLLGAGKVIQGWDDAVTGMKVGERRKLTIPPNLGYGAQAQGSIPPNSTLLFDVELLGVE